MRQLVTLHGGSVTVVSEGEGKGSEFIVRIPLAEEEAASAGPAKVVSLFGSHTILVVDDNRDAADTLALLLREHGYCVVSAYDGESALRAFNEVHPALALLDLGLPDIGGLDVAREIRKVCGNGAVLIALTGWGQPADRESTAKACFDAHVVKPVDPSELLTLIQEQLSRLTHREYKAP